MGNIWDILGKIITVITIIGYLVAIVKFASKLFQKLPKVGLIQGGQLGQDRSSAWERLWFLATLVITFIWLGLAVFLPMLLVCLPVGFVLFWLGIRGELFNVIYIAVAVVAAAVIGLLGVIAQVKEKYG